MENSVRSIAGGAHLAHAAELVTRALERAPFGVAIVVADRVVAVNQRLAGWQPSAEAAARLIGSPAARADELDLLTALAAAGRGHGSELRLDRIALAGPRPAAWRVHTLPFAIDGQTAIAILIDDQSEQTHTAEAFAASERRFRLLVDAANDGIAVHRDGVLLYANPAAAHILGYQRIEDIIGRSVIEFVHPDYRPMVTQRMADLARGLPAPLREEVFVRADGSNVVVEVSGSRAPMGEGYANFVFFRDITERKQLQAEALRMHRMESLGRLAGGIAHDFNNLISTIQSALSLAQSSLGQPEALGQALAQAESATLRAADLTRNLLTFSRGGEAEASAVNPNDVVRESAGLLGLGPDKQPLELALDPQIGTVWIDPSRLHQVVMNLLVNALDAIGEGGRIRVCSSRVHVPEQHDQRGRAGDWIVIEVADTGSGMTAETQSRIFEPFFTTKPSGQGTGLGLSTVYGVVRQAGGWVEVESAPARGARFRVFLPAVGVTSVPPESAARPQQRARKTRVLICDDEVRLAALTVGLLEQHGMEAEAVPDARTALERLSAPDRSYDLLLLDVNMTGMTAGELLERMVAQQSSVPVVLSSGYAEEDVPRELLSQPLVAGYLAKPYPAERLFEVVEAAARRDDERD